MSLIASSSNDLKLHHWPDGVLQQAYAPAHYQDVQGHIRSISWGKDGSWIVLVPFSGQAEIISIKDSVKLLYTVEDVHQPACATFQNSTKKHIALGTSAGEVLIYDIKARSVKKRLPRAGSAVSCLQFNSKDTHLAAANDNGEILVYNTTINTTGSTFRIPKSESISVLNFHRTRRNFLSAGSDDGIVVAWDTTTKSPLLQMQAHQAPVTSLTFSPIRSDLLVTGGLDRRFTFYDILANKCILEVEVRSSITALDFSYCGTYLGLGSQAGTIVLYDTRNLNKPISAFPAHTKRIYHLNFQKMLPPKEQDNNSSFDIVVEAEDVVSPQAVTQPHEDSLGMVICDDGVGQGSGEPDTAHISQDSFLAAMGLNESSELGVSTTVMSCSKRQSLGQQTTSNSSPQIPQITSVSKIKCASSTPKLVNSASPQTYISPIVNPPMVSPIDPPPECLPAFTFGTSPDELKTMIREVVKEELQSQIQAFRMEMREEFTETLGHMRRHFLDLQLSIVKEFVAMEGALEGVGRASLKEFVCDEFLLSQNTKLLKELDLLKEQMVEKDLCRKAK